MGLFGSQSQWGRTANPRGEVIIVSNKTKKIGVMFFFLVGFSFVGKHDFLRFFLAVTCKKRTHPMKP